MMQRKELYTNITPLPSNVPRQLALDILHSHSEIITLNPLVLDHHPVPAPRTAHADEYYSTWYEIAQRVQYVPGFGKLGAGKISFKGSFENAAWGLKTHTYPPMGIDLKSNFRIGGNHPDEPLDPQRVPDAPASGLYLLEEVEIKCSIALMSFVKSQLKAASKVLVDRLIKKAELLDSGALQAMFEDGKLKTFNPADKSDSSRLRSRMNTESMSPTMSFPQSPTGISRWGSLSSSRSEMPTSYHASPPGYNQYSQELPAKSFATELPDTSTGYKLPFRRSGKEFPVELPAMEEVPTRK
ncbi:hypothetical protein N7478_002404 [Penicillium angulare]|uniref:uncharacterized protein n=1 Tax=Penicillium angulare TaxID=116970 RepID=UPI00254129FE|nr:uncharacterized protein N7478_002404 [Penicillium angulare]KAJ5286718.1 hypothetical protein N7478_002404 [Penicillium angulare]